MMVIFVLSLFRDALTVLRMGLALQYTTFHWTC